MRYVLSLLLVASLAGCGAISGPTPTYPLAHLLNDCPGPSWPAAGTNRDLVQLIQGYQQALDLCNADKAALREWANPGSEATE